MPNFSNGHSINDIVIALPAARLSDVQRISPSLEKLCVPTRVVIDLGDGVGIRDRLIDLGGIHMLDLRPTLAETGSYLFQKRAFDLVLSLLILLLSLPLFLLIALAVKLSSRGPVFFAQERVRTPTAESSTCLKVPHHASRKQGRGGYPLDLRQ